MLYFKKENFGHLKILMKVEEAIKYFKEGYNCAQSILYVFAPEIRIDPAIAVKIATPFGGGMGKTGSTCGAVSGALMVIGLRYGSDQIGEKEAKIKTYKLSEEFIERFKDRNGTTICKDLIEIDPRSKEFGINAVKIIKSRCPKFVRDAVEIVEEIIRENG